MFLNVLPDSVTSESVEYSVDVPDGTSEILVYLFASAKVPDGPAWRGYYQVYTQDEEGTKYSQYLNVAFEKDDYSINSSNMWLPLFSEKKFYIIIPDSYPLQATAQEKMTFRSIKDTITAMQNPKSMVISGVFLSGYRA